MDGGGVDGGGFVDRDGAHPVAHFHQQFAEQQAEQLIVLDHQDGPWRHEKTALPPRFFGARARLAATSNAITSQRLNPPAEIVMKNTAIIPGRSGNESCGRALYNAERPA